MTNTFTLEELQRFALNGTLESHILSNGLIPMQILEQVLTDNTLHEQILQLQKDNEALEEIIDDLKQDLGYWKASDEPL